LILLDDIYSNQIKLVMESKMANFEAKIIADSINPENNRVTTFLLTYPRFIHSEIYRRIELSVVTLQVVELFPIEKIIEQVSINPATPIRWGKNGKSSMQDHGFFCDAEAEDRKLLDKCSTIGCRACK
jgi:hypothetical protein